MVYYTIQLAGQMQSYHRLWTHMVKLHVCNACSCGSTYVNNLGFMTAWSVSPYILYITSYKLSICLCNYIEGFAPLIGSALQSLLHVA